ncbi:hypothetical protein LUZ60_006269 [Juncus effusus]|nr:hypothetical protein LUZ60_006269 [Juncus effusus]
MEVRSDHRRRRSVCYYKYCVGFQIRDLKSRVLIYILLARVCELILLWAAAMALCQARDFLFCALCGTTLTFESPLYASCPNCGFKRPAEEIEGKELSYTITAEDIRRELKIEPFVVLESAPKHEEGVQRATVNEACPVCHHPQLEYYTKQLRSADEGQTVFYECPKCKYKSKDNT